MYLLNLKINLQQQGRSMSELTTDEVAQLNTIAENSRGAGGAEAWGILEANYGHVFCDCLNVDDNQGFKSTTIDPGKPDALTVFPNPASGYFIIGYDAEAYSGEITIKVNDINGKPFFDHNCVTRHNQEVINAAGWQGYIPSACSSTGKQ